MKVVVGADHRGVKTAEHVAGLLKKAGHEARYVGPVEGGSALDYPDQAYVVGRAVSDGDADRGILVSGSGMDMAMTANKFAGVRAVVGHDEWIVEIGRAHHDANVLCLPADFIGLPLVGRIVDKWMKTAFETGGRHERRVRKIGLIEGGRDPRGAGP